MDPRHDFFEPCAKSRYLITATSYDDKRLSGTLYCPYLGCAARFENLMQLLIMLEHLMDEMDYPQRGLEHRVLPQEADAHRFQKVSGEPPLTGVASFRLSVLFRQNASWQGTVTWVEGRQQSHFRSELELVSLLDNALTLTQSKAEN